METIRGLILSLVALVLLFSAVDLLLPEGPTRGYARFVCGLLLMMLVLEPLAQLINIGEWREDILEAMSRAIDGGG